MEREILFNPEYKELYDKLPTSILKMVYNKLLKGRNKIPFDELNKIDDRIEQALKRQIELYEKKKIKCLDRIREVRNLEKINAIDVEEVEEEVKEMEVKINEKVLDDDIPEEMTNTIDEMTPVENNEVKTHVEDNKIKVVNGFFSPLITAFNNHQPPYKIWINSY